MWEGGGEVALETSLREGIKASAAAPVLYSLLTSPAPLRSSQLSRIEMIASTTLVLALALGVTQVSAHGGVLSYNIGGQTYDGWVSPLSLPSFPPPFSPIPMSPPRH